MIMIYQLTIEKFDQLYKKHLCNYVFYQRYNGYVLVKQAIPDKDIRKLLDKQKLSTN
jgi:hypothetical protein